METPYRYSTSPAENGNTIIEILDAPQNKEFIKQLIYAFVSINVEITNYEDLWMNEEIVVKASSVLGPFTILRDYRDHYFIAAPENPAVLPVLDSLLAENPNFNKI